MAPAGALQAFHLHLCAMAAPAICWAIWCFLFLFGFTLRWLWVPSPIRPFYVIGGIGASPFTADVLCQAWRLRPGASGAFRPLMAMYAVMYRMRRIRFFTCCCSTSATTRWSALIMLPV